MQGEFEDVRHTEPNQTGHRQAEFRKGWKRAVAGERYGEEILRSLTWNNLGYRLGRLFGETSAESLDQMYDWCVRQQAAGK